MYVLSYLSLALFFGRVNTLLGFGDQDPRRIHGAWTFLFSPLHFN